MGPGTLGDYAKSARAPREPLGELGGDAGDGLPIAQKQRGRAAGLGLLSLSRSTWAVYLGSAPSMGFAPPVFSSSASSAV